MRRSSAAAALAVVAVVVACARPALPPRLAGLHRTRVWTGARAARMVADLHGRDVAPHESVVADYGPSGQLRVWLARYPDGVEAAEVLTRMVEGMRGGRTPFSEPHQLPNAPGRWVTVGPGGHSVIWASGPLLYWLQGEPETVLRAADELPPPSRGQLT